MNNLKLSKFILISIRAVSLLLLIAILGTSFISCEEKSHLGKYYVYSDGEIDWEDWIELRADGTWCDPMGTSDEYSIEGNTFIFNFLGAPMMIGTIEDGHIVFDTEYSHLEYYLDGIVPEE